MYVTLNELISKQETNKKKASRLKSVLTQKMTDLSKVDQRELLNRQHWNWHVVDGLVYCEWQNFDVV